jgi:hypothetical protein
MFNRTLTIYPTSQPCEQWKKGLDCSFDEWNFYFAWAIVWTITACVLVAMIMRSGTLTGRSRYCLALAGFSAFLSAVDSAIPIIIDQQPKLGPDQPGYANNPLSYVGTICLGFALYMFVDRWCEVAAYLEDRGNAGGGSVSFIARSLSLIRGGYKFMAFLHVPFALLRASSNVIGGAFHNINIAWTAWLFVSTCCVLSVFAVLMFAVARSLSNVPNSKGVCSVATVNLCEQMLFNFGFLCVFTIYWIDNLSDAYHRSGNLIGACNALTYFGFWAMHIQVLFFFMVVNVRDPMFSGDEFRNLISMEAKIVIGRSLKEQEQDPSPSTIGSNSPEVDVRMEV